jgi:hypothetical protein
LPDDFLVDQAVAGAREQAQRLRNRLGQSSALHVDQDLFVARDDAARKAQLREAILNYVREHALAADTVDGILACWLPDKSFEDAAEHIDAVLETLVAEQHLRPYPLPDGNVLYVSNAMKCSTSQQTS